MSNYEEIPPGTALINSIRAEKAPYYLWAGEAIDNSLDASATLVQLEMTKDYLACKDNGIGVTREHEKNIVKISAHGEMGGTKLGRFGIGIKYKSIQHGTFFEIQSVSKDGKLRRSVDWQKMLQMGRWMYPPSRWIEAPANTPTGTTVIIKNLLTKAPTKKDFEKTYAEIQRRYYPALEAGTSIILNEQAVETLAAPLLTEPVSATLTFPGGREARIRGGLLAQLGSKLRQVDLCVAYRVIKPESIFGTNGYGGIRAMYARIDLVGPWKLTKFKDDIADDPYEADLETAVENVLRPILEKCQSDSMTARHHELEQMINDLFPEEMRARPPKEEEQNRKGPKRGDKTEKSINGKQSNTGPVRANTKSRGFKVEFVDSLCEECGYGRAQFGKTIVRIQLAKDNPTIGALMNMRDQTVARDALFGYAGLILEIERSAGRLDLGEDPVGLRAWKIGKQNLAEAA